MSLPLSEYQILMHLKYGLCPHQLHLNRAILQKEDGKKAQKQSGKYNAVQCGSLRCKMCFIFQKHCSPYPTGLPPKLLQVRHLRLDWRRHLSSSVFPRAARTDCQVSGLHSKECSQQEPVSKQMCAINYTEVIPAFK